MVGHWVNVETRLTPLVTNITHQVIRKQTPINFTKSNFTSDTMSLGGNIYKEPMFYRNLSLIYQYNNIFYISRYIIPHAELVIRTVIV